VLPQPSIAKFKRLGGCASDQTLVELDFSQPVQKGIEAPCRTRIDIVERHACFAGEPAGLFNLAAICQKFETSEQNVQQPLRSLRIVQRGFG
jgi:hypothetical protein